MPGGGRGIEVREHIKHLGVLAEMAPDKMPAADAGKLHAKRMVPKARNIKESFVKPLIPRQGQSPDASAETAAKIAQVCGRFGVEFQKGGRRAPEIGHAAAVGIGLPGGDAVEHMVGGIAGDFGMGGAVKAPGAEKNRRGGGRRQVKGRRGAPPVAVADHPAAGAGLDFMRFGDPAADAHAAQGLIFHLVKVETRMRGVDLAAGKMQQRRGGLFVGVAPETGKIRRTLRRGHLQELVQGVTAGRVELEGVFQNGRCLGHGGRNKNTEPGFGKG